MEYPDHECTGDECCPVCHGGLSPEDVEKGYDQMEFTETRVGHLAREWWARAYDDLNGAPENDGDR